jgi:hypothetical protein
VGGTALSSCVPEFDATGAMVDPCGEQLGMYRVVLLKKTPETANRRLVLKGPFRGLTNPDETVNHVLGDEEAEGLIYTLGDYLSSVIPLDECTLRVTEVLNIAFGTGKYAGIGGQIGVKGTLDICKGVNEFTVDRTFGEICFGEPAGANGD